MLIHGRVLAIGHETDNNVVASALRDAKHNSNFNELALHAITLDQTIAAAYIELLRHDDREWKNVELINCRGQVETAIILVMSVDRVKALSLIRNIEMVGGYAALGTALQATTSLLKLRLTSTIQTDDATALAEGLRKNTSLESIEFRWSTFDEGSVNQLARGLSENMHVKSLDFFGCALEDEDLVEIVAALQGHPTLGVLILNGNKCGVRASSRVAAVVESEHCALHKLDLSFQRLDSRMSLDISLIAPALTRNTSLQTLDFTCNGLDDEDAERLAQAMCENSTLKELFLARNKFTDTGITSIALILPKMDGLKKLSLWGNPFGEEGAMALLNGMASNMELYDLHLFKQFKCSDKILYFTTINRGGRKLLQEPPNSVPTALWPLVLERANTMKMPIRTADQINEQARINMLYCLLHGPVLLARGFDFAVSNS
jgi:Ran GTPase-activating protein (RanGAP) involved in mRNA processing and transport